METENKELNEKVYQAKDLADVVFAKASESSGGIKEKLYKSSSNIQEAINKILSKQGVLTQEQVDQLDEQIRIAKSTLLEAQSKKTFNNILIYGSIGIVSLGILWYLTRQN